MSIYNFNKPEPIENIPVDNELKNTETDAQKDGLVKEIATQEGKQDNKQKIVVVDGPLSHVYTKALNIALANESVQIVSVTSPSASEINESSSPNSTTGADNDDAEYVYVIGDKVLTDNEAMEAYNAISKAMCSGKYKKLHVAVEGALSNKMNKRTSLVLESCMKMGVNVIMKNRVGTEAAIVDLSASIRK